MSGRDEDRRKNDIICQPTAATTMPIKKQTANILFQRECIHIFKWAGYRCHTIFHLNRFPVIGDWNSWERLNDHLEILIQGKEPEKESDKTNNHVLDVVLFQNQNPFNLNLVKTDMFTIVFVDPKSPIPRKDEHKWCMKLNEINGSIVYIEHEKSTDEEASDNLDADKKENSLPTFAKVKDSRDNIVRLGTNENIGPNQMDVLSAIFHDINDALSEYQEKQVRNVMKQCKALIYNNDLKRNDPPDGYYLCNAECLQNLKRYFSCKPHTFATINIFHNEALLDKYILLAVEVKLTLDSLQCKLDNENYYILLPAPHPIRNLVIVNGGQITRTWLFLINLAHVDSIGYTTLIDQRIYARYREFAQRFRFSHTHVVYMSSFSSETFRQEPLTRERLNILCKLVKLEEQKIQPITTTTGSRTYVYKDELIKKKECLTKKMVDLLPRFMNEHPVRDPRSSVNESVLLQTDMHTGRLFCFLETLALSFVNETQKNLSNANKNIRLPKQLEKRALDIRTIKPALPMEVHPIKTHSSLIRLISLPNDSEADDDLKFGEQPT